jgi:FkbM family methyltransferase
MPSWSFAQDRWVQSTPAALKSRVKGGLRQTLLTLGYDVRRVPKPSWIRDPWQVQRRLLQHVERPVIFDVGANVGQTLERYASTVRDARIHSFEPFPDSYRHPAAVAAARPPAVAHQLALGAARGEATFHVNPQFHTRNSLLTRPAEGRRYYRKGSELPETLTVTVDTLDDVCAREGIDRINLLKLDVQGAELQVLRGGERLLAQEAVDIIFMEVMFVPHYENGPLFHEVHAELRGRGYSLYNIFDLISATNGQLRYANALFVSDSLRSTVLDAFAPEP